jgi:hypothetical protein
MIIGAAAAVLVAATALAGPCDSRMHDRVYPDPRFRWDFENPDGSCGRGPFFCSDAIGYERQGGNCCGRFRVRANSKEQSQMVLLEFPSNALSTPGPCACRGAGASPAASISPRAASSS